ncbi:unnamed protein product [Chrysodeixis includens]|uniref:Uncharacterized protein n=1 Tax=Chrysodeixis includens TaxID=689277 RepID=A0A9N8L067_CHRIL|nr:unnamed protein product [Chrysodeixis includens]
MGRKALRCGACIRAQTARLFRAVTCGMFPGGAQGTTINVTLVSGRGDTAPARYAACAGRSTSAAASRHAAPAALAGSTSAAATKWTTQHTLVTRGDGGARAWSAVHECTVAVCRGRRGQRRWPLAAAAVTFEHLAIGVRLWLAHLKWLITPSR